MNIVYWIIGAVVLLWFVGGIHRRKGRRNKVIRVVEANCTGCRRCVKRCSHRVLEPVTDETGIYVTVRNPDRCTACGDCMGKCKFNALELVERI
ncbi:MAG: 4Fe-4S binding protein [Tannerellaceae bacterium]|nr:4Fe-4S binding protein [Tannerellaceae bacterium]